MNLCDLVPSPDLCIEMFENGIRFPESYAVRVGDWEGWIQTRECAVEENYQVLCAAPTEQEMINWILEMFSLDKRVTSSSVAFSNYFDGMGEPKQGMQLYWFNSLIHNRDSREYAMALSPDALAKMCIAVKKNMDNWLDRHGEV